MDERTQGRINPAIEGGMEFAALPQASGAESRDERGAETGTAKTPFEPAASGEPGDACMICHRPRTAGIHICEAFICEDCEKEIVETEVGDAKYPYFIMRMRQIWHRKNA